MCVGIVTWKYDDMHMGVLSRMLHQGLGAIPVERDELAFVERPSWYPLVPKTRKG